MEESRLKDKFVVHSYQIRWITADQVYDAKYDLVPSVSLFESVSPPESRSAVVFFRPQRVEPTWGYDELHRQYKINLLVSEMAQFILLIQEPHKLILNFKEQDGRRYIEIVGDRLPHA